MPETTPKTYRLSEYQAPEFFMSHVELEMDLTKDPVQVKAKIQWERNLKSENTSKDLILDSKNMELKKVLVNGTEHSYTFTEEALIIHDVPNSFTTETITTLGINTDLFGLYKTNGAYLVKAETQGLRRVFPLLDRPDVLATYKVTIKAKKDEFPNLLCNGNLIDESQLEDGVYSVTWEDNLPKPSYLFAMVAGRFKKYSAPYASDFNDNHITNISFFIPPDIADDNCAFTMKMLQEAMQWDEKTFKLPCELEEHKVVAFPEYASGASEPTTLNLFNSSNFYAHLSSKTDDGFLRVAEVVSHEYFHYRTGNRVTIRDWFNLTFKEGLTTFRASLFMEDQFGADLMRLYNGKIVDSTPSRPDSYINVRRLYTTAAYEKGAEIFRMMMNTMGKEAFTEGLNQFLTANDNKAVTIEDLITSLNQTSSEDLKDYLYWFTESEVPQVSVTEEYYPNNNCYILKIKTTNRNKRPIPIAHELYDEQGKILFPEQTDTVDKDEKTFRFEGINSRPIPSLLRNFSAPVTVDFNYSDNDLLVLMQHDTNPSNRYESFKTLFNRYIDRYCKEDKKELPVEFFNYFQQLMEDDKTNPMIVAQLLTIPGEEVLASTFKQYPLKKISEARQFIASQIAEALESGLRTKLEKLSSSTTNRFDIEEAGKRRLKKVCLNTLYALRPDKTYQKALDLFNKSIGINMTDTFNSLTLLCNTMTTDVKTALDNYYEHYKSNNDAMDYWFKIQAGIRNELVLDRVKELQNHPAFNIKNPNKVYALFNPFINNPYGFHHESGEGYKILSGIILQLDKINPTVAANLIINFNNWYTFKDPKKSKMKDELDLIGEKAQSDAVKSEVVKLLEAGKEKFADKLMAWAKKEEKSEAQDSTLELT